MLLLNNGRYSYEKAILIALSLVLLCGCGVSNSSTEPIQIKEELTELVVTYPDGLSETITDPVFLDGFKESINNQLVLTEIDDTKYEMIYSVEINGKSYDCFDMYPLNSLYNTGVIKINNQYYKKDLASNTEENTFNIIKLAHTLKDGTMNTQYKKKEIATSIDELFSNISIASEPGGYQYNGRYSYNPVKGNGTGVFYDLDLNEYRLSFPDNRTMSKNEMTYNWTTRIAKVDNCEYDRNTEDYSNCTQYEKDWIEEALNSFLICNGVYMDERVFIELENQYDIRSNKPNINFGVVDKIEIISADGLNETITDKVYIDSLVDIIYHKLVETTKKREWPHTYTLIINGVEILLHLSGYYSLNSFLINNYYYEPHLSVISKDEHRIIRSLINVFALIDGSNDIHYDRKEKVNTIDRLFRDVHKQIDEQIVLNSKIRGAGGRSNGTTTVYDFNLKEYRFSFLNKETMKDSFIVYNWIDRTTKLDNCEYNRDTNTYTDCSDYQQAWIQEALDAFLVSCGSYMDEADFLAQENDYIIVSE